MRAARPQPRSRGRPEGAGGTIDQLRVEYRILRDGGTSSGTAAIDAAGSAGQVGGPTTTPWTSCVTAGAGGGGGGGGTVVVEYAGANVYTGSIRVTGGAGGEGGCHVPSHNGGTCAGHDGYRGGGGGGGGATAKDGATGWVDGNKRCPAPNGQSYFYEKTGEHGGAGADGMVLTPAWS